MAFINSRQWRHLAAALLCAALLPLTACGTGTSGEPTAADKQMSASPTPTEQPVSAAQTPAPQSHVEKGKFGDVTIPANPTRIVGLYMEDNLTALGVTPIVQADQYDYLGLNTPLFNLYGDSLEVLLQAQPDLILMSYWYAEDKLGAFGKIAPTYVFDWDWAEMDWRAQLRGLAKLLRKQDKAEQALQEYETKTAQTKPR